MPVPSWPLFSPAFHKPPHPQLPSAIWALLPSVLLWFLLGYGLYAVAFGSGRALVARQEEVQLVTAPIAVVLILGYLLCYAALVAPDALWLRILCFVPTLRPVLMPVRVALGHVAISETRVTVIVVLASIVSRPSSAVYSAALTRGGPRLSSAAAIRRTRQSAP